MAGFWASVFRGALRRVTCPHCGREQVVGRRPLPFELRCGRCGKAMRVTEQGVRAIEGRGPAD